MFTSGSSMSAAVGTSSSGDGMVAAMIVMAKMYDKKNQEVKDKAAELDSNSELNKGFDAATDSITPTEKGEGRVAQGSAADKAIDYALGQDPNNTQLREIKNKIDTGTALSATDVSNLKAEVEGQRSSSGVKNDKVLAAELDALMGELNFFLNMMKETVGKHNEGLQTVSKNW